MSDGAQTGKSPTLVCGSDPNQGEWLIIGAVVKAILVLLSVPSFAASKITLATAELATTLHV